MEFVGFPKIPRYSRECVITEKIDGTNAQICITPSLQLDELAVGNTTIEGVPFLVYAGSRTRWITPHNDNHGFAKWVQDNIPELTRLGSGRHFGEWWGQGINRGYGLKEKRFSLFNVKKWDDDLVRPACCHVVPIIHVGLFSTLIIDSALWHLREHGSYAAPGFMRPEGIIIYHVAGNLLFKKTIEKDDEPKGKQE